MPPPEASTHQDRGARRKVAMLDAALALFLENGYAGTSLDMVIERAGGSRRTIYEQFGNKQGLFVAAIETLFAETSPGYAPLDDPDLDTEEALTRAGTMLLRALLDPRMLAAFRLVISEAGSLAELGDLFFREGPGSTYRVFADYLRRRAAAGALSIDDAPRAARQLVELIKGDLHLRALLGVHPTPSSSTIRRHVKAAVATFLEGAVDADR